jgi:hypothetical protein
MVETGPAGACLHAVALLTMLLGRIDCSHAWQLRPNLDEVSKNGPSGKGTLHIAAFFVTDRERADWIVGLGT